MTTRGMTISLSSKPAVSVGWAGRAFSLYIYPWISMEPSKTVKNKSHLEIAMADFCKTLSVAAIWAKSSGLHSAFDLD